MKKPTLIYSPESLKSVAARVKNAETVPGATARRLVENLQWQQKQSEQVTRHMEIYREFISEFMEIFYGPGKGTCDLGKALDDVRALVEKSNEPR